MVRSFLEVNTAVVRVGSMIVVGFRVRIAGLDLNEQTHHAQNYVTDLAAI